MANKEQKAKPSGKREPQLTLKEKRAKKAEKKKSYSALRRSAETTSAALDCTSNALGVLYGGNH